MFRLSLLILLLTVVYSWEECKFVFALVWSKLTHRNQVYQKNPNLDILVSDLVLIATIPINLAYLLLNSADLAVKLIVILAELVVISLLLKGLEEYSWRRKFTEHYTGSDKIVAIIFSFAGLVSPSLRFSQSVTRTTNLGKYLWHLILPLAFGLMLALLIRNLGQDEIQSRLDLLITVATLGLVLNATIEILEKLFRSHKWHLTSLMRVALGILIIFIITRQ